MVKSLKDVKNIQWDKPIENYKEEGLVIGKYQDHKGHQLTVVCVTISGLTFSDSHSVFGFQIDGIDGFYDSWAVGDEPSAAQTAEEVISNFEVYVG